jgi:hypothetical protein
MLEKVYVYRSKKFSGCQGLGEGGVNRWNTADFQGEILYMILERKVFFSIYLSKLTEHTTPRMNPKTNYGLWVLER